MVDCEEKRNNRRVSETDKVDLFEEQEGTVTGQLATSKREANKWWVVVLPSPTCLGHLQTTVYVTVQSLLAPCFPFSGAVPCLVSVATLGGFLPRPTEHGQPASCQRQLSRYVAPRPPSFGSKVQVRHRVAVVFLRSLCFQVACSFPRCRHRTQISLIIEPRLSLLILPQGSMMLLRQLHINMATPCGVASQVRGNPLLPTAAKSTPSAKIRRNFIRSTFQDLTRPTVHMISHPLGDD